MKAKKLYSIAEVAGIIGASGQFIRNSDVCIGTLAYDSRKLHSIQDALFFAIRGTRDGHDYIAHAYTQGVRNFVISDALHATKDQYVDANFLIVKDTLRALQFLASFHRSQFDYPVLAITGSNGKTIVKDWLFQLLSPEWNIVRSPKSFNSQLGVALSLWEMDRQHTLAIIEAGISRRGEMEHLATMIRPDIAVLTNIGTAHQDGFTDSDEKTTEKLRLLNGATRVVFPRETVRKWRLDGEHWDWGADSECRLQILDSIPAGSPNPPSTRIQGRLSGETAVREITIPFTDAASIENALTCWTVMLMFGYDQATINERMARLQVMEMRLEMKQGIGGCLVIDDSYSNDLSSLRIALDFLRQQKQHSSKTLILSDMPQVGNQVDETYLRIRDLLRNNPPDRLITVGSALAARRGQFPVAEHLVFQDTDALVEALPTLKFRDQTILLKGARSYAFERVSARLVAKSHETVMEINMNALEHNVLRFKSLLAEDVKIMVMVKAFSYGSGSSEIAGMLQFLGVDYLAVAYADEGVALRQAGISLPIMVMSPDRASFEAIYAYRLEPELFSFTILNDWLDWLAAKEAKHYPVHLKFDTGMHRLGFSTDEVERLADILAGQQHIRVQSVFSHLAASGDPVHDRFTRKQLSTFGQMADRLALVVQDPFVRHIANTDAIMRFPEAHLGMVRVGIGLYGLHRERTLDLQEAIQLKTTITQVRQLPEGETVGYSRRGMTQRKSRIATVGIGYADGYDRRFGNGNGAMYINGHPAPTIGDICMDMCMLDVTDLPFDIFEGDEVQVYGGNADLVQMAEAIGTIPYELLVNISQRVKRVYYYG